MKNRKRVAVLLAAYNGMNWITEQIESILQQQEVLVTIFISVDLSSDGTENLVSELCHVHNSIVALPFGQKFGGAANNFYRLIREVDFTDFDYVSLADQDDIWYENKLIGAINILDKGNDFYSSNVLAFWPNGKIMIVDKAQKQVEYDYFFEAAGPGCTYVFKSSLATELKKFINDNYESVTKVALHDWLIYAYARHNNYRWYIDKTPTMDYRQHGNNQVGANVTLSSAFKRIGMIRSKWYREEIVKISKVIGAGGDDFITSCLENSYKGNFYMMKNIKNIRRRLRDRVMLFIACLIKWF